MSTDEILKEVKAMTPKKRAGLVEKIRALDAPPRAKTKHPNPDWNEHREWMRKTWGDKPVPGISLSQLIIDLRD